MLSVIEKWVILTKLCAITAYNACDVSCGLFLLHVRLPNPHIIKIVSFHISFLAPVINLGVKESLGVVRKDLDAIRSLIKSIYFSVKVRDTFEKVKLELGESKAEPPGLDVSIRFSSTFLIIKKRIFWVTAVLHRIPDLLDQYINEAHWSKAKAISYILYTASSSTESQSGNIYITLSICAGEFKHLLQICDYLVATPSSSLYKIA